MRKFLVPICFVVVAGSGCQADMRKELPADPSKNFPKIPGDPQTAVRSFRHLYQAMIAYRTIHGQLPTIAEIKNVSMAIVPGVQLTIGDIENADAKTTQYATYPSDTSGASYTFSFRRPRPNGLPKPAFPRQGEKDLWITSRHYMRSHVTGKGNRSSLANYGVVVGLFSDGDIQVRSMDQLVGRRLANDTMEIDFPDETGMPKDIVSVNTMLRRILGDQRRGGKPASK